MKLLFSLLLFTLPLALWASDSKVSFGYGIYSISAKANGKQTSITKPLAFSANYQKAISKKLEVLAGYTVLLGDMTASDLGYGFSGGFHYYILTSAYDETIDTENVKAIEVSLWKPYVGIGFYQRNFQSIKNSYAGFGASLGTERYLNKKINLMTEARAIRLSGNSSTEATEYSVLMGIILKI